MANLKTGVYGKNLTRAHELGFRYSALCKMVLI